VEAENLQASFIIRHVKVSGNKGSDGNWPNLFQDLPVKREFEFAGKQLVDMCELTRHALQDSFEFVQFTVRDGHVVIGTKPSETFMPVDESERPRRFRRIAYRVSLTTANRSTVAEISTAIEWRIPKDRAWFPEDPTSALCERMIIKLKQSLSQ
jgi:hypothetical protein